MRPHPSLPPSPAPSPTPSLPQGLRDRPLAARPSASRLHRGGLVLVLLMAGCSTVVEKSVGYLSSNADVLAVKQGQVLLGRANFARERRATLELQSRDGPPLQCLGRLRYTATSSGTIDMSCSDASQWVLPFQELSPLVGIGQATEKPGTFRLSYGLPPERAAGYLGVPLDQLEPAKSAPAGAAGADKG